MIDTLSSLPCVQEPHACLLVSLRLFPLFTKPQPSPVRKTRTQDSTTLFLLSNGSNRSQSAARPCLPSATSSPTSGKLVALFVTFFPLQATMATIGNSNNDAKIALLGEMGAEKSSLVLRFVKGQFLEFEESTIGAAFFSQTLALNDATLKFEICYTAGRERYHSLAPKYYRGAAAAIIVHDITSKDSFEKAKKWVQELQKQGNPSMVIALAGNKANLEDKKNVILGERHVSPSSIFDRRYASKASFIGARGERVSSSR